MIRITQRLNAGANKGILYRFCGSWKTLDNMVNTGIRISDYTELTWDTGKNIDRREDNRSPFASFTRNPSAIIQTKNPDWRYAVILDGSVLSDDYNLKPYSYFFRPGRRSYTLEEYRGDPEKGDYYLLAKDGAIEIDGVRLTAAEGDDIVRWASNPSMRDYVKFKKTPVKQFGNMRLSKDIFTLEDFEDMEEEDSLKPYLKNTYYLVVNLGNEEIYDKSRTLGNAEDYASGAEYEQAKKEGHLKYLPVSALPKPLYRVAQRMMTESEERLYPHKRKSYKTHDDYLGEDVKKYENVNIDDALLGVLIPDSQYFTTNRKHFEMRHRDVPIYLYRDNAYFNRNQLDLYKLRYALSQEPELMEKYKFPR